MCQEFLTTVLLAALSSSTLAYPTGLGTKTPYYPQALDFEELPPPTCVPVQVNMVLRHGSRFPTIKVIRAIEATTRKLQARMISLPMWLETWNVETYYPVDEAGQLAPSGVQEMIALGQRIRRKYARDFASHYAKPHFTFESTWKDRTRESATSFAFGFFDGHQPVHYEVAPKGADTELRFFDNCPAYDHAVELNATATLQYSLFANSEAMQRNLKLFQEYFNLSSLTIKDLDTAYDACAFDVAVYGIFHHWCSLFPDDVLHSMEYFKELKQYYRKSHGNAMAVDIAAPLIRDIVESMRNYTDGKGSVQGHFRFAHAETLLPLVSILGFHKDEPPLMASTNAYDRRFRTSELSPFSGNLAFVLYACENESKHMVQVVLNEKQVESPGLGCIYCPLTHWTCHYDPWISHWDFQAQCTI
ncbi:unnamed protein product [Aphanomyces euteiches]|nr:hypothetical protein AeRB84_005110 [Aphanomyces euteiches]